MIEGDRITFDIPDFGDALTFTFSADADNKLHLTPVQPMDPGDAFVFASQPWTRSTSA
jgi:hypothetical protein